MRVAHFSAGVSSAVATKLANPDVIIYIHIEDQHPDTLRFVKDCEKWFGKPILRLQSELKTVESACRRAGLLSMFKYKPCTLFLKKEIRKRWETENPGRHTYIWGYNATESKRMDRLVAGMPEFDHEFPISSLTKEEAHAIIQRAGIRRPEMYDLGYPNNNCVGCLKGSMGYWNKIREDFPEVFEKWKRIEREFGHSIIKKHGRKGEKGTPIFLDELPVGVGRNNPVVADCGASCEIVSMELEDIT